MAVPKIPFGGVGDRERRKYIRAANLEYALYTAARAARVPQRRASACTAHRPAAGTSTWRRCGRRRRVRHEDRAYARLLLGHSFRGRRELRPVAAGDLLDVGAHRAQLADNWPGWSLASDGSAHESSSFRTTAAIIQRRIINPDAIPGIDGSFIDADMINLVIPATWDKGLSGSTLLDDQLGAPQRRRLNKRYTSAAWIVTRPTKTCASAPKSGRSSSAPGSAGPALLTHRRLRLSVLLQHQKGSQRGSPEPAYGLGQTMSARWSLLLLAVLSGCGAGQIDPAPLPQHPPGKAKKAGAGFLTATVPDDEHIAVDAKGKRSPQGPRVTSRAS